jgi:integrase
VPAPPDVRLRKRSDEDQGAYRGEPDVSGPTSRDARTSYSPWVVGTKVLNRRVRGRSDATRPAGTLRIRHSLARVDGKLVLLEPKTERSRRTITLPEVVVDTLRGHRTRQKMERLVAGSRWVDSGHVFATTIGTPMEAAVVTRSFQRALERAGLPHCRFHDLRHAAATFLLAQGFTLEDVKNLLGHSSIGLTSNTYGHVLEQRQREVAMGMDALLGG